MSDDVITIAMRLRLKLTKAQKEIEAKDAKIERLRNGWDHVVTRKNELLAKVDRLQAVVEAFTDKLIKLPAKDRWELEELIAALEEADDE